MDDARERLAGLLHENLCNDMPRCGRWGNPESGHQAYYQEMADRIIGRLEPEIGIANVYLAATVIIGEVL
jgi:hypothetical protein